MAFQPITFFLPAYTNPTCLPWGCILLFLSNCPLNIVIVSTATTSSSSKFKASIILSVKINFDLKMPLKLHSLILNQYHLFFDIPTSGKNILTCCAINDFCNIINLIRSPLNLCTPGKNSILSNLSQY